MSTTQSYAVSGMTCDHCARSVRAEVSALEGVTTVDVDVPAGQVTVTSNGPVPLSSLDAAISEAGYRLSA